jgi:energy-coupling factor transport system permease protein
MFILALLFNHPVVLGALLLGVIALGLWSRLSMKDFVPILAMTAWFVVLSVAIWPGYIHQGREIFRFFGASITLDGVLFGIAMGLRVALMIAAAGVWMMTTSPQKMTLGLLRMGLPYKAGMAMSSAIRFTPFLNAERETIKEAQQARGVNFSKGNPIARLLKSVSIIVPLFSRAFLLAQQLALAMDARGFGARENRTSIVSIQMTRVDRLILMCCLLAVIIGIVFRILGIGLIVKSYL